MGQVSTNQKKSPIDLPESLSPTYRNVISSDKKMLVLFHLVSRSVCISADSFYGLEYLGQTVFYSV